MSDKKKPEEKPKSAPLKRERDEIDTLVSAVRETKTPCNRTSFSKFSMAFVIRAFTNEEGEVRLKDLVKEIREFKGTTSLEEVENIKL